jgi:hypothetical protein
MCSFLWNPCKRAPPRESPDYCGGETGGSQRAVRCGVSGYLSYFGWCVNKVAAGTTTNFSVALSVTRAWRLIRPHLFDFLYSPFVRFED